MALKTLEKGFPAGATDPTVVLLRSTDGSPLDEDELTDLPEPPSARSKASPRSCPGQASEDGTVAPFSVFLDGDPASDAAIAAVKGPIRDAAHEAAPDGTEALVGGTTSVYVDFQAAMNRDYKVVFPVAALRHRADPRAAAAQPGRAALPDGLGRPRLRGHPGRDVDPVPEHPGQLGADLHPADLRLSVRGRARHRLQHPDDRAAARGGSRGSRAACRRGRGDQARRARRSPRPG